MAEAIRMPKMSDTMTEGVIVAWHKQVGDAVKSGDILAEVETDKATMELENYFKGTLLHIGVPQGQAVPVDHIIAVIGKAGEDISGLLAGSGDAKTSATEEKAAGVAAEGPTDGKPLNEGLSDTAAASDTVTDHTAADHRIKASPLARKMAAERGLNLEYIQGSGDQGRIVRRDIEGWQGSQGGPASTAAASAVPAPNLEAYLNRSPGQGESFTDQPLSQMRKTIARRLSESKNTAPHFYLNMEIDMDEAVEARTRLNLNAPVKISINDLVIKAVAMTLRQHPGINASWLGDRIRFHHHIHVGVAMALPEGLVVPVLRFADQQNLVQIASTTKDFAARAKNKQLQPHDWEGNTFTISNLGMFGIDSFTAIINPPDACILAVGAVQECPVVRNGQLAMGRRMKVTLSCDHRVVDGATGAAFLQTLSTMLKDPVSMLL